MWPPTKRSNMTGWMAVTFAGDFWWSIVDVSLQSASQIREYCMDLVSLETQQENDYIQNWLESRNLTYTWTSGRYVSLYYQSLPSPMNFRLCDFDGCDRPDLKPINIKGWFWTGSNKKIAPTNKVNEGWVTISYQKYLSFSPFIDSPANFSYRWDYKPWSTTGHLKKDQPDNAEFGINK